MTVKVTKPAVNLREELAKGTQKYTQQQFWFDSIVTNGTFDTDTDWTKTTGAAITGGQLVLTNVAQYSSTYQVFSTIAGKEYQVVVDLVSVTSGQWQVDIRKDSESGTSISNVNRSSAGQYNFTFTAESSNSAILIKTITSPSASAVFDNISVYEVDSNGDVIHILPTGWKPLHVYEDGALQREGDANDYTVVKTGDSYSVKPAVAPSASTQTCVIAELEL